MIKTLVIDMDGTVAQWGDGCATPRELLEKGYFISREPERVLIEAIRVFLEKHPDVKVYILSAYMIETPYPLKEKNEWLDKYMPFIPKENRIFVPYGLNKTRYFEEWIEAYIDPTFLMLEDYSLALRDWAMAGGSTLKFMNGINGTKGTYSGPKLYRSEIENSPQVFEEKLETEFKGKEEE